ncbi:hypothetical protein GBAR_LOCUS17558, partial [Geodia barretti]
FQSACDAQNLNLETSLTLPTTSECGSSSGCLEITKPSWIFKDVYLTCIVETDYCRDVSFTQLTGPPFSIPNQPAVVTETTSSPLMVEPNERIVIRAEIISGASVVAVSWHHGTVSYHQHIREDPFCNEDSCVRDNDPRSDILRSNRVRTYLAARAMSTECAGSSLYSLETYLIVDNATESDAGTYLVNVTTPQYNEPETEQVNVTIDPAVDCTPSPLEDVIAAVCSHSREEGVQFRNETRSNHGIFSEATDTFAVASLFSPAIATVRCQSSCTNFGRGDVTWCVRIADVNRTIETCLSLDDNNTPVFQSTCDAQNLNLETSLTLPTATECGFSEPACLGLRNINWVFKDAYLTCIVETDNCRDVSFVRLIATRGASNEPPVVAEITSSPLIVEPNEKIVIRAEILSSTPSVIVSWHHGTVAYHQHIREDPFCDEGSCVNDTHPDTPRIRSNRVRTYVITRRIITECVGSSL